MKRIMLATFILGCCLEVNTHFIVEWSKFFQQVDPTLTPIKERKERFIKRYQFGFHKRMLGSIVLPLAGLIRDKNGLQLKDVIFTEGFEHLRENLTIQKVLLDPNRAWVELFNFVKFKYWCIEEVEHKWNQCCFPNTLEMSRCKILPSQEAIMLVEQFKIPIFMEFAFLYWWCIQAKMFVESPYMGKSRFKYSRSMSVKTIIKNARIFCPDSCLSNPCRDIPSVKHPKYCRSPFKEIQGMFQNEFLCDCIDGMEWSSSRQMCVEIDLCKQEVCNKAGTLSCEKRGGTYVCTCKEEFSGIFCQQLRDSCKTRSKRLTVSGDIACRTSVGSKCVAVLGTDTYACSCAFGLSRDFDFGFDNCYNEDDSCSKNPCKNGGACFLLDRWNFTCRCRFNENGQPSHTGRFCEKQAGQWSRWSLWTPCISDQMCYRYRKRVCLDFIDDNCFGISEDIQNCSASACGSSKKHNSLFAEEVLDFLTKISVIECVIVIVCKAINELSRRRRRMSKQEKKYD